MLLLAVSCDESVTVAAAAVSAAAARACYSQWVEAEVTRQPANMQTTKIFS
jgi:hypothetical protein